MPSAEAPVIDGAVEVSSLQSSPTKEWYRQKAEETANEVQQLKKKVKTLQQSKRRLSRRIDASQDLVDQLKEQNLLSEKGLEVFQASFSPDIQQLLERAHEKTNKQYPSELRALEQDEHDYTHRVDVPQSLSVVSSAIVPYIAGFVARKVRASTNCEESCATLQSNELPDLIAAKNRGGLVAPSKDVIEICSIVEKGLRVLQHQCKDLKFLNARSESLLVDVMTVVFENALFSQLEPHLLDCDPLDNHIYNLSKKIASLYIKTRVHHISKGMNQTDCKKNVRTLLTREIIFKNL